MKPHKINSLKQPNAFVVEDIASGNTCSRCAVSAPPQRSWCVEFDHGDEEAVVS